MSEEKMGTQYAREICQSFRDLAEKTEFPEIKEKLLSLANELEPMAPKLYFKTQKGTEDMQEMAVEIEDLQSKLLTCQLSDAAQGLCTPFFGKLEKIMNHVKTMKVRMT